MKIYFNKTKYSKKIFGILIFSILLSSFIFPQRTSAQVATIDAGNIAQSTITAANTTASNVSTYSLWLKEYVLDGLGTMIVKQIVRQITSSVVAWINSGFEGSPSFLQNPGSFFLDVADQITGDFIAKAGGPLQDLCSPFSIDIRIALAFKYRPNEQKRYACTITTIINNSKDAVENASINGFTAGDFKQGGWPAFVSLSTEPQNNIYGAYLSAESDLSWRVANARATQKDEISNGRGFLSWRDPKCKAQVKQYNTNLKKMNSSTSAPSDGTGEGTTLPEGTTAAKPMSYDSCPVKTPGSVIQESLQNNLNGPLRELEIADEINEVVNALFAQLITQVLQKGLSGVSSKDESGSSYLDRTIADTQAEANPQVQNIKSELTRNLATYKANTTEYRQYRNEALNLMLDVKNTYDAAKACYNTKINSNPPLIKPYNIGVAQSRITDIDNILTSSIALKTVNLLTLAQNADASLKTLQEIEDKANAAQTLNDLNTPSQLYSQLLSSRSLITAVDIQKAKADLEAVKIESAGLKNDANRKVQECQSLN